MALTQEQADFVRRAKAAGWPIEKTKAALARGSSKFQAQEAPAGPSDQEVKGSMMAIANALPEQTSDADLKAHQEKRGRTLSSMLGDAAEFAGKYTPLTLLANQAERALPNAAKGLGQSVQDFETGVAGGLGNVVEGVRQGWNKGWGDEEELGQLNLDTELRRRKLAELTKANPKLASAGEFVGEAAPSLLVPGAGVGAGAGFLGRVGAGAATGAAEGFASALTPGEEAGGERASRAKWGLALGGLGGSLAPRASQFGTDVVESTNKMLPEDAAQDFFGRTTGFSDDVSKTYGKIKQLTDDAVTGKEDELTSLYNLVEGKVWRKAGSPSIAIKPDTLLMHPDIYAAKGAFAASETVREIADSIKSGKSDIPYVKVTQAIRELNKLANGPRKGTDVGDIAESLAAEFRKTIDDAAQSSPQIEVLKDYTDSLSAKFSKEMAPLRDAGIGAPVGTWNAGGRTEKDFADTFLSDKSGGQLQDLFDRVPGSEDEVRKYFATVQGAQPEIRRALGASSTRDVLFKNPEERKYATKLSKALRGGADDEEMTTMRKIGRRFTGNFNPALNFVLPDRVARGVLPYGMNAKTFNKAEKTAQALRGAMILNAAHQMGEVAPLEED